MPQKIINIPKIITSANNNQYVDIYTPAMIDGYQCDAIIYDFFVTFDLKSIDELPYVPKPEGGALWTKEELDRDFNERTSDSPSKIFSIYYEVGSITITATSILCYRQSPNYTESMMQYLTTQGKLGIAFGTKIKVRIEANNSGLLGNNDTISLWIMGEEIKEPTIDELAIKYLS
ncbi:hypothetical protein [Floridanema evergladense]|uniref:Uncharacterized protein n=1 Tax=Floridaenema evergladense BLCC-F167 TaxID=3153639 RepID=A0ABV4WEH7_9CYAN